MLQSSKYFQSIEQHALFVMQLAPAMYAALDQKLATVLGTSVENANTH